MHFLEVRQPDAFEPVEDPGACRLYVGLLAIRPWKALYIFRRWRVIEGIIRLS